VKYRKLNNHPVVQCLPAHEVDRGTWKGVVLYYCMQHVFLIWTMNHGIGY